MPGRRAEPARLPPAPGAIPLALYVHVPWCVRKCPYCDFNSHAARGPLPEMDYVAALLEDLDADVPAALDRPLHSIFIGGGTPSLLSPAAVGRLLAGIGRRLAVAGDCEVTLEANPGTMEAGRFIGYREAGVNRLSIGVQSFDDAMLERLGRIHSAAEARRAVERALAAGFDAVNLDLMFALPEQDLAVALRDLEQALALGPVHLSWYQLTLEPNTLFHASPPPLPDDDAAAAMWEQGQARLVAAGFRQYEVSAYARDDRRCRHNVNYWAFGDYLGIGAGAHGKHTTADGRVVRTVKQRHPEAYLRAADAERTLSRRVVEPAELGGEFMLNALRLREGVPARLYGERTGQSLDDLAPSLAEARAEGLLAPEGERLRATELGYRFLDRLVGMFLA